MHFVVTSKKYSSANKVSNGKIGTGTACSFASIDYVDMNRLPDFCRGEKFLHILCILFVNKITSNKAEPWGQGTMHACDLKFSQSEHGE